VQEIGSSSRSAALTMIESDLCGAFSGCQRKRSLAESCRLINRD